MQNSILNSFTGSILALGVVLTPMNSNSTQMVPQLNVQTPSANRLFCYRYKSDSEIAPLRITNGYSDKGIDMLPKCVQMGTEYRTETFMPIVNNEFEANEYGFEVAVKSVQVIKLEQGTKWVPKSKIEWEAYSLFGEMRDATEEETASVDKYIESISFDTGANFFDLC